MTVTIPEPLYDSYDNVATITAWAAGGKTHNVVLQGRTLYKDGTWNTLCLPFAVTDGNSTDGVTFSGTPLEGAILKALDSSSFANGTLTLNFKDATEIEAGKPYIVKWTSGGANITNPIFESVTISAETVPVETASVNFIGTTSPVTLDSGDRTKLYLGGASTLYYPSTDVTINSFRAYFELNNVVCDNPSQGGYINAFVLNFGGDEATGIVDADFNLKSGISNTLQQGWFTLDGRKLPDKPKTKGIYINNGHKVVIK